MPPTSRDYEQDHFVSVTGVFQKMSPNLIFR